MTSLEEIAAQVTACRACGLCRLRTKAVPGEGPANAQVVFIGEAPGWNEDKQGRPFVGAAGQLLNELLAQVQLPRDEVYITNVVKCRPPDNRDPLPEEINACRHYLDAQLALIKPKVVVTLGRFSMARYFVNGRIGQIHGQAKIEDGVAYLPLHHPAAVLRQASLRTTIEADMQKIPQLLANLEQAEKRSAAPAKPEQLSLF